MRKSILTLLAAILACFFLLTACSAFIVPEAVGPQPESPEAQHSEASEEDSPLETESRKPVSVYCMTGFVYTDSHKELVYTASYEVDGIHLTPESIPEDSSAYLYVYSWDGRLLLERLVEADGTEVSTTEFTYDEHGNLVKKAYTFLPSNSTSGRTYTYDSQGKLLQLCYFNKSEIVNTYTYSYDERGFIQECFATGHQDVPQWRYVYSCDEHGNPVSCQRYVLSEEFGKTGLQSDIFYTYDDAGRLLELIWKPVFDNNYLRVSKSFTYDDQGRMIRYQTYHQESRKEDDDGFFYDEAGHLIRIEEDDFTRVFTYGEVTLDSFLAEFALQWSSSGVITAYLPSNDPLYRD